MQTHVTQPCICSTGNWQWHLNGAAVILPHADRQIWPDAAPLQGLDALAVGPAPEKGQTPQYGWRVCRI